MSDLQTYAEAVRVIKEGYCVVSIVQHLQLIKSNYNCIMV